MSPVFRSLFFVPVAVALVSCGSSDSVTGPDPDPAGPMGFATVCLTVTGSDPDSDGIRIAVDGDDRTMNSGCETWDVINGQRSVYADDVAPHCVPTDFQHFDEPWGYLLGHANVPRGGTGEYGARFECGPIPDPPWGRLLFSVRRTTMDSLAIHDWPQTLGYSVNGGPTQSTHSRPHCCYRPDITTCLGVPRCEQTFAAYADLPSGRNVIEFPDVPVGTIVCQGGGECGGPFPVEVQYGKTVSSSFSIESAPSGQEWIVFTSERAGSPQLFGIRPDGTALELIREFGPEEGSPRNPALSPDGSKVVVELEKDHRAQIHVLNANGTGLNQLTDFPPEEADDTGSPDWSPSGTDIVFHSDFGDGPDERIWTVGPSGSGMRLVDCGSGEACAYPSWGPMKIAFSKCDGDRCLGSTILLAIRPNGSEPRVIIRPDPWFMISDVAWSPQGSFLAFTMSDWSRDVPSYGIYVIAADGTGFERISAPGVDATHPTWSPDAQRIAFTVWYESGPEIWIMGADGTDADHLTDGTSPDWGIELAP